MHAKTKAYKCLSATFCYFFAVNFLRKKVYLNKTRLNSAYLSSINFDNIEKSEMINNKMNSCRPNYFICFPLNNEKIGDEIVKIQNHVITKYNALKDCVIEKRKFHISLLILYIRKSQLELSKEAFNEAIEIIQKIKPPKIVFNKLDTFNNNVLYLNLKNNCVDYVKQVIDILKESFTKRDIKIIENKKKKEYTNIKKKKEKSAEHENDNSKYEQNEAYDKNKINKIKDENQLINDSTVDDKKEKTDNEPAVIPHLTIMKNSMLKRKFKNKRKPKIFEDYYSDFDLTNILKEQMDINKIQLLEMELDKSTSYYKIVTEWKNE